MARRSDDLDQVGFLLGRAYYTYIGFLQRWIEEAGLDDYVKPGMGSLLFALFREDGRSMTDVGTELQLAKSTMTGLVSRMRETGLIQIEPDPQDARLSRLRLTPLARTLEPRCRKLAMRVERFLCRGIEKSHQPLLRSMLVHVTQVMSEDLQKPLSTTTKKRRVARQESAS